MTNCVEKFMMNFCFLSMYIENCCLIQLYHECYLEATAPFGKENLRRFWPFTRKSNKRRIDIYNRWIIMDCVIFSSLICQLAGKLIWTINYHLFAVNIVHKLMYRGEEDIIAGVKLLNYLMKRCTNKASGSHQMEY